MNSFVTLEREDYDDLVRDASRLSEMITTIDLILDALKEHMAVIDGKVVLESFVDIEEIGDILRYRHPEAWSELEAEVIQREKRKEANDDKH